MKKESLLDKLASLYMISLFTPPLWLFITASETGNFMYGILGFLCTILAWKLFLSISEHGITKP